jgi:hypothetical protein
MKKLLLFVVAVIMAQIVAAQTVVFQETFEPPSLGAGLVSSADSAGVPTTNFTPWALSTHLAKSGTRSDSNRVQTGKTIYLTSTSFSTTGNSYVILEFSHICKLFFSDGGMVEVSNNNGATWTTLGPAQYLGTGVMIQSKFSENSYGNDWFPGDTITKPTNSWWKTEKFDISSIAANQPNVRIRFKYIGSGNPAGAGRYGWLIDEVKVTAAPSELIPPTITMNTYPTDTVYSAGPYNVSAYVKDNTGVDTVWLSYQIGNGAFINLGMTKSPTIDSLYSCSIPFPGWGKKITYSVTARDVTTAQNLAYSPASGYYSFFIKYATAGTFTLGTGTSTNTNTTYPAPYGNWYWGAKHQILITKQELNAMGAAAGPIMSLAFDVATVQGTPLQNFYISIGHTTATALASGAWQSNLTTVYTAPTYTEVLGWNTHNFTTPFNWNGNDNIVIEVCFNNSSYTYNAVTRYTPTTFNSVLYYNTDASTVCPTITGGTASMNRPNMKLVIGGSSGLTQDVGVAQITYPTGGVTANQAFNVQARIKNFGTAVLNKATIKYSIDNVLQPSYVWNVGGLAMDSLSAPFVVGSLNLNVGPHQLKVWAELPNDSIDQNNINDTAYINFFACASQLSGTYTIGGTGANFANFAEALTGLTQCGINGPVVFNVNPGTYNEQISIPEISGASATNTITFKAANDDSTSVTLSFAGTSSTNWIVRLNGADFITFKNMTFAPLDSTNSRAVLITNGATYNNFIGNRFIGYYGTDENQSLVNIFTGANNNNTIRGNNIIKGSRAINIKGTATLPLENVNIVSNLSNNAQVYGIYAQYINKVTIDSNTVNTTYANTNKYAIYAQYANHFDKITKNTVILGGGTNMYGILVENSTSADSSRGLVANNFVSITDGSSYAYGIRINSSSRYNVYFNSVVTNGNNTTDTRALNIVSTSSNINLYNNNLQSNRYPIYVEGTSVAQSNYNNFYSTGTTFAYWGTQAYTTLNALKAATNRDTNSLSINPFFVGLTNLHTFNGLLYGMGISLPEVTNDIDGAPRANPPCIGADEFTPPPNDASLLEILTPITACGLTNAEIVKVVIKNVGATTMTPNSFTAAYRIANSVPVVSSPINRTVLPGDTIHYSFATPANMSVATIMKDSTFTFKAWVSLTGDYAQANDSTDKTVVSKYLPPDPIVQNVTIPWGNSTVLTATSNDTLLWYATDTSTTPFYQGKFFTTPVLFDTITYYVAAGQGSGASQFVGPIDNTIGAGGTIGATSYDQIFDVLSPSGITIKKVDIYPATAGASFTMVIKNSSGTIIQTYTGITTVANIKETITVNFQVPSGTGFRLGYTSGPSFYRNTSGAVYPYTIPGIISITGNTFSSGQNYWYNAYNWEVSAGSSAASGCQSAKVPITVNVVQFDKEAGISKVITPSGCGLNMVPISIKVFNNGNQPINGNITARYKIDNGNFTTPEPITTVIPASDTITFTFATLANLSAPVNDTFYKVTAEVMLQNDPYAANNTNFKDSILSRFTPPMPTASGVNITYGMTATLNATSSYPMFWYSQPTGGNSLAQGATFTTPPLYNNTTYYVEANTSIQSNVTLGTGTSTNTTTSYPAPYGSFYWGAKHQILITKAELNALGITGGPITSLAFEVIQPQAQPLTNFTIAMAHTTLSAMVSGTWATNLTTVYTHPSYVPTAGWNTHTFTTPFIWNGNDNIIVETCFNNSSYTNNSTTTYTATTFNSVLYYNADASTVCSTTSGGTVSMNRPNMKLIANIPGCSSPRKDVVVVVGPPPQNDAGVTALVNPSGNTPAGVSTPIKVKVKNYGQAPLTSVNIAWRLNGAVKPNYSWTGNIAPGADSVITIANETFAGGLYCIKAWTFLPNNILDSVPSNDTLFNSCFTACLNGTYTIGDTTGGVIKDFPSFNAAVNALKFGGVCGPVTFLVDTGTYNEQVRIPEIMGASAINTITFKSVSNDSTKTKLQFASTVSTLNYTLLLDSADYIRFEKMTIRAIGTSYGRVIELRNGANNNIFSNNVIEMPVTTSSNYAGVYDYTTLNQYNKYLNNVILNGYYGMYIYGISTTVFQKGTEIIGNRVQNFYYYGIMSYYQDSVRISRNIITSNTASTYVYGLYMYYCPNAFRITKNQIILTNAGSSYGMYMSNCTGTSTATGLVANNMVALANGTTSSTNYGIYPVTTSFANFYYNTVLISVPSPSSGNCLYQSGGTANSLNFINNNFVNTGGGRAAYYATTTAINLCNFNNYFTTGTTLAYWTTNQNNLAALKAASGKDSASVSINPLFFSNTDLHLQSTDLSAMGTPLAEVTDDIDGQPRGLIPTIGADEVPMIAFDAGITSIITPLSTETEGNMVSVKVYFKNFGTNTLTSIPINYKLNNQAVVTQIWTGNLPSLGIDSMVFNTPIIVPAGNNSICAYTTLQNDSNSFNDQKCKNFFGTPLFDAQTTRVVPIQGGCNLSNETVKIWIRNRGINAINSTFFASYTKVGYPGVIIEPVTVTIPVNDSILYTFNTPIDLSVTTQDINYTIKAWVTLPNDNIHSNDTAFTSVNSLHTPDAPVVNNVTIPYGTSASLFASSPTNDPLYWFEFPTGGSSIFNGTNYVTPYMYATDTFYVESNTNIQNTLNIGTGTTYNSTTAYPSPYTNYYGGNKHQILILASELSALGISAGPITSISFNVKSLGSTFSGNLSDFQISMKNTSTSVLNSSSFESGLTTVYGPITQPIILGYNTHQLSSPFNWDGVSNLLIQTSYNNGNTGTSTDYVEMYNTTTSFVSTNWYRVDGSTISAILNATTPSGSGNSRPNMKIVGNTPGCSSPRQPLIVNVGAQSPIDAGVIQIVTPNTGVNLTSNEVVKVRIKNFGSTAITNFNVRYKIGNNPVVTQLVTDIIQPNDILLFTFAQTANVGTVGQTYCIKSWTSLTNDATPLNDTASKCFTNNMPVYCISTATSPAYEDITNVTFNTINNTTSSAPSGNMYSDFTNSVAPTFIQPGMTYPISITSNFVPGYSTQYTCWVNVFIDYNRDGVFDTVNGAERAFASTTTSSNTVTGNVTIPFMAIPGPTLMRVVMRESGTILNTGPCGTYTWGETEDYTVMIIPPIPNDAGVSGMSGLGKYVTFNQPSTQQPQFYIRNYGSDPITNATVKVNTNGNITTVPYTNANGLASLGLDSVLATINLQYGMNNITAYTELAGDTNFINDTIKRKVFREYATTPPYFDNFETNQYWYASDTANGFPIVNLWEQGVPKPSIISSTPSPNKCWATKLDTNYIINNASYLYTPTFQISPMEADTLKFWHWRRFGTGATGQIQYLSGTNNWLPLGVMNDSTAVNWYNNPGGWTGIDTTWKMSKYPIQNLTNLGNTVQFRFVFTSSSNTPTDYGWAIDDFSLSLKQIAQDGGVTNIITPTANAQVGDSISVKVTVKNFGLSPLTNIPVKYLASTSANPVTGTVPGPLAPGASVDYTFTQKYVVGISNFSICAFTAITGDYYTMNDSTCKSVTVSPANKDVGITQFIEPESFVYYGQSVKVKVVIKNFGTQTQTSIPVYYQRGTTTPVSGLWTGTLNQGDTAHYTFTQTFTAPTGSSFSLAAYTDLAGDAYPQNNKLTKSVPICLLTAPSYITGPEVVNAGQTGVAYEADSVSGATSYQWEYSIPGAVVINGNGTRFITVDFLTNAVSGVLSVKAVNSTCYSLTNTKAINVLGISDNDGANFWLGQNVPNPTTGQTSIEYQLPENGQVKFNIMNLFGQVVFTENYTNDAGRHTINLDVSNFAAGVYYYTIELKGKRLVKKMVINK